MWGEERGASQIVPFYLPPYAPQFNPDEQVWGNVKARVSKRFLKSIHELKRMVLGTLRHLQKLPHVVQELFRHLDCTYAV